MNLEELNEEQKKAVLHTEGPLLIVAGAGSGKTKVLTSKVAYLIEKKNVLPSNILAITFTNKAAKEMKERMYNLIGNKMKDATICTFHSFGWRILKEYCTEIGYQKNISILDSDDCLTVIKKILKDKNYDAKIYNPKVIRSKISNCKNEMIDPNEYMKTAYTEEERVAANVYKSYEKKLFKNNSVDFDDLLVLPILIFESKKEILSYFQDKYKYLLIDEYQDTNVVQYKLSKMLASKNKNICVVGDSDQSIYSFRGANYRNILNFEKDYNNATTITLNINYRSSVEILECANCVISNNKERVEKKLISHIGEKEEIKYSVYDDQKQEANSVIQEIVKLNESGIAYNDMAIIYRTNAQSRVLEESILKYRIPYTVVGSYFFYNRKEIKDLLSYLRVINNYKDDINITRIINVPKRKIGTKTVNNLLELSNNNNSCIFDELSGRNELEFKKIIVSMIEKEKELKLTELIDYVLEKSGMRKELKSEKNLDAEIRLENLEEFKSITKEFELVNPEGNLSDFLNELTLVSDVSEYENETDKLSLLTIHAVKGLEYKVVFLVGLEEEVFPHINSIRENSIEEERRLCYVAITRAKEKLYISHAKRRLLYGDYKTSKMSRFIDEMNIEIKTDSNSYVNSNIVGFNRLKKNDLKSVNYNKTEDSVYCLGDKVTHNEYGDGIVVEIDSMLVTIAFNNVIGIKKIMKTYKYLTKL